MLRIERKPTWKWGVGRSPAHFEFTVWLNLGPLCLIFDPHYHE